MTPNIRLELERSRLFYLWSQEFLSDPLVKTRDLNARLKNPSLENHLQLMPTLPTEEVQAYYRASIRYHNRVGALMQGEPLTEGDQAIIAEMYNRLRRLPRNWGDNFRDKKIADMLVQALVELKPAPGTLVEIRKASGEATLNFEVHGGWYFSLYLDAGHRRRGTLSTSVVINNHHFERSGGILVGGQELGQDPNSQCMRQFPMFGWMPFNEMQLDYYLYERREIDALVADLATATSVLIEDLKRYCPLPPLDFDT